MKDATLLFLIRGDEILLAMKKRGFGEGKWNGVGGKIEKNETIEQALVRECEEEVGVTPLKFKQVAINSFQEFHGGKTVELKVHIFMCDKWAGGPTESDEMAPCWFSINKIPYKEMWPDDIYWLPKVLKGKKLICEFTLDSNEKVKEHKITEVKGF